jgi:hypothetical protein
MSENLINYNIGTAFSPENYSGTVPAVNPFVK